VCVRDGAVADPGGSTLKIHVQLQLNRYKVDNRGVNAFLSVQFTSRPCEGLSATVKHCAPSSRASNDRIAHDLNAGDVGGDKEADVDTGRRRIPVVPPSKKRCTPGGRAVAHSACHPLELPPLCASCPMAKRSSLRAQRVQAALEKSSEFVVKTVKLIGQSRRPCLDRNVIRSQ